MVQLDMLELHFQEQKHRGFADGTTQPYDVYRAIANDRKFRIEIEYSSKGYYAGIGEETMYNPETGVTGVTDRVAVLKPELSDALAEIVAALVRGVTTGRWDTVSY